MVCLVLHASIGFVPLQTGELVRRTHWGHKVCSSDKPEKKEWSNNFLDFPPLMYFCLKTFCNIDNVFIFASVFLSINHSNSFNVFALMYFCWWILVTLPMYLCWCISVDILLQHCEWICAKRVIFAAICFNRAGQSEKCFQRGKGFPRMPTTQTKNVGKLLRIKSANKKYLQYLSRYFVAKL